MSTCNSTGSLRAATKTSLVLVGSLKRLFPWLGVSSIVGPTAREECNIWAVCSLHLPESLCAYAAGIFDLGQAPTTKEAQAIADSLYSEFVGEEVDKVELIYTKFVSLIASEPIIQTLLPLTPQGEICDIDGKCVDAADDEIFKLTTREGKLAVEREDVSPCTL